MKSFKLSLIGILLTSNLAAADNFDKLLIEATTADLITTELALRNPRLYETNPIMSSPYARIGIKSAMSLTIIGIHHEMIKDNHKKAANIITGILIGFYAGVSIHNYNQMRKFGN